MALVINMDDCTSCDACPEVCPNKAISVENSNYVIDPANCTECVGAHDEPQCVAVCPADCIIPDPNFKETPEQLQEKYRSLHG
ncbi:MAG: YfhL family 4Fe-4S dicluster ferredoxin [Burkholderiales bacterium]|nr:YfhL family 4Fe-4S dicluster ferredoxin [Burkholderiales bacterium]